MQLVEPQIKGRFSNFCKFLTFIPGKDNKPTDKMAMMHPAVELLVFPIFGITFSRYQNQPQNILGQ
jgi:hypothetical protein